MVYAVWLLMSAVLNVGPSIGLNSSQPQSIDLLPEGQLATRMQMAQRRSTRPKPTRRSKPKKSDRNPGESRTVAGVDFVWIPGGKFTMGSKYSASSIVSKYGGKTIYWEDEFPSRSVTLTEGVWLASHEVSNRQFAEFVEEEEYVTDAEKEGWTWSWDERNRAWSKAAGVDWKNPGWDDDDNNPVVCVSWNDANAYIEWMNKKGAGKFRLPTEAQWECACRAGSTKAFPWGDRADDGVDQENVADLADNGERRWQNPFKFQDGHHFVSRVKSFAPNAWGAYDMIGNVREWCNDWYEPDYYETSDNKEGRIDPKGPSSGADRAIRGGSWFDSPENCRAANRSGRSPDHRYTFVGFRISMAAGDSG